MREKALMAWSSGKDSALALHEVLAAGEPQIVGLLTTVTEGYERVSMHGVRLAMVEEQSRSIGIPLVKVMIPQQCSEESYETIMRGVLTRQFDAGVRAVVFGDLFLQWIREYREKQMRKVSMTPVFPLWERDTRETARRIIGLGFHAIVTCVDTQLLDGKFAGRAFDAQFLTDLPEGVDPCGENGEFHTFVHDGPIFRKPVSCVTGETVLRDGRFNFCDVLSA